MKKVHVFCLFVCAIAILASCSLHTYQSNKANLSLSFQIPQYLKGNTTGTLGRFIHPHTNKIEITLSTLEDEVITQDTKTIAEQDSVTFTLENIPINTELHIKVSMYDASNKLVGSRTTTIEPIITDTTVNITILPNEEDVIPVAMADNIYQISPDTPEESGVYIFKIPELNKGVHQLVSYKPEDYQLFLYDSEGYAQGTPTYVDSEDDEDLEIYHFFGNTKKEDMYLVVLGAEEEPPSFSIQAHNGSVVVVGSSSYNDEFGEILKEYTEIDFGTLKGSAPQREMALSLYNPYNQGIKISKININVYDSSNDEPLEHWKTNLEINLKDLNVADLIFPNSKKDIDLIFERKGYSDQSYSIKITLDFDTIDSYTLSFIGSVSSAN